MNLRAWRVTTPRFAAAAFTGEGARIGAGRWNNVGTPLVYASGSLALATLEQLVRINPNQALCQYAYFEVSFDEAFVKAIDVDSLPERWWRCPPPAALRNLGDDWAASMDHPILRVPSAVVRTEWNYLLNPLHPEFGQIKIGPQLPLRMDKRLR